MKTYWVAVKNGVVKAVVCENHYSGIPKMFINDLRAIAHRGPISWIASANPIEVGDLIGDQNEFICTKCGLRQNSGQNREVEF